MVDEELDGTNMALYQHLCHEVQNSYNTLSVKELQLRPTVDLLPQQGLNPLCHIGYTHSVRRFFIDYH